MDLKVEWLSRMRYREAWDVQRARHAARFADEIADTLLLVEHEPVLTLGRHARDEHVIASPAELARRSIEVIRVERGGEVTYHGPGQVVAYTLVDLRRSQLGVRQLVSILLPGRYDHGLLELVLVPVARGVEEHHRLPRQ